MARVLMKQIGVALQVATVLSGAGLICFPAVALAQDEQELLPPPPVKVLQNRFFKKALRPELSGFLGTALNEAYSRTFALGARLGFFVNEWIGADYSYARFMVEDSAALKALRDIAVYAEGRSDEGGLVYERTIIEPSFVTLQELHAVTATLAPIYGKINLFDFMILYSDIYFSAGTGILTTSQDTEVPVIFGVGQRFYFAKHFNVRIDASDHIFQRELENFGKVTTSTKHAWVISFGLSAFLW